MQRSQPSMIVSVEINGCFYFFRNTSSSQSGSLVERTDANETCAIEQFATSTTSSASMMLMFDKI